MATPPDVKVDRILQRYGITREQADEYIDAIVRMNQKDAAGEIGVTRRTVNQRYQKAFADMTPAERDLVRLSLAEERCMDRLTRVDDDETDVSEEGGPN